MLSSKIWQMLRFLSFSSQEKETLIRTSRLVVYFFVLLFLVLGLWKTAKQYEIQTFSEYGPVETCQLIILSITSLVFFKGAVQNKIFRPLLLFFCSLTLFASIRELDHFFEELIPLVSWKFAWFLPLAAVYYLFKKRAGFKKILFSFLNSCAFQLMFMAMVIFIPLAQCIGHRSFITDAVGSSENLIYIRRMIEESAELIAYVLIFLASIELHLNVIKEKK